MKDSTRQNLFNLFARYPCLKSLDNELQRAIETLSTVFSKSGTLFVCGNGGSCADSAHITGELVKSFCKPRSLKEEEIKLIAPFPDANFLKQKLQKGLPCVDLTANIALQTAIANDSSADLVFAQQLFVYGRPGDVLLALTTSGNSRNVYLASQVAKSKGMWVIVLQGSNKASKISAFADILLAVPERETYKIQELHLPIYHAICLFLEQEFFGDS